MAGTYIWKDISTLVLQLRYIDSPHTLSMMFHFAPGKVSIDMQDSFAPPERKITLSGKEEK